MVHEYLAYISKNEDIEQNLQNGLDFIKYGNSIKRDSTVFIKPNFTFPDYRKGITTSPGLIKVLCEILKDRAGRVIVGESDGGNRSFTADQAFKGHNLLAICRETGAEMMNLSQIPWQWVSGTIQRKKVRVKLPSFLLDEVDCFISVPVLKVHVMTTVTLSMKNLWGCYPDTMRCLEHKNLSEKLTLITEKMDPKFSIIDGSFALNGHGPMFGNVVESKLLITANNPVVADALGSVVMGIPLSRIEHILMAEREGLGTTNLDDVELNDDWKKYQMQFYVQKTMMDHLSTLFSGAGFSQNWPWTPPLPRS